MRNNNSYIAKEQYDSYSKQFGPKKFVGFKNMTAEKYEALKRNRNTAIRDHFDSSLTSAILDELATRADEYKERELFGELVTFMAKYDKYPRNPMAIYLVR